MFDAYTPEIMSCRRSGIVTGLPDSYGRGRIIGDYRRVALYGVDRLLEVKQAERAQIDDLLEKAGVPEERRTELRGEIIHNFMERLRAFFTDGTMLVEKRAVIDKALDQLMQAPPQLTTDN